VNYQIFSAINGLAGDWRVLDLFMIFAAKYLIFLFFAAAAVVTGLGTRDDGWWPYGAWRIGKVLATLAIAFVLSFSVRLMALSERPFETHRVTQLISHAPGVSMPSDHAVSSFAVAIAVWFFVSRRWGPYFLGVAAVIAISRVYVGVHYPADVTAGALLAAVAGLGVWAIVLAVEERVLPARQPAPEDDQLDDESSEHGAPDGDVPDHDADDLPVDSHDG